MPTPPRNPYIAGKALGDSRGFFGREDVFRVVETVLSSPDQNSVVLFGQRRIGKTSILLNLGSRLSSSSFVPVYFDLMDRARKSLGSVLYELAATITNELKLPQAEPSDFDDEGRRFREQFLPTVYAKLGERRRLVLLFDEFDVLDIIQEEQLLTHAAARAFFPYLRELMTKEPRLGFVFVVGRKAEELGIEFQATFKASRYYHVSVLDDESAYALVRVAEYDNLIKFDDTSVMQILKLTAKHPFFTQLVCQLLFDKAHQDTKSINQTPVITPIDVDNIVPQVLVAGANAFAWIWSGLRPVEKIIFANIAQLTDKFPIGVPSDRLKEVLAHKGTLIWHNKESKLTLDDLVTWELIKKSDTDRYQFSIELIRLWVLSQKPLQKVQDELDSGNSLANQAFHTAEQFFEHKEYADAIKVLESALNQNPNHLEAGILLGRSLSGIGKNDEAIKVLEIKFQVDKEKTGPYLSSALRQRATYLESSKNKKLALDDYKRILQISPNDPGAREHSAQIHIDQGREFFAADKYDQALGSFKEALTLNPNGKMTLQLIKDVWIAKGNLAVKKEQWDKALQAFEKADAKDKIADVKNKQEIQKLIEKAKNFEQQKRFQEAIELYQQLQTMDSKNKQWEKELVRARKQITVTKETGARPEEDISVVVGKQILQQKKKSSDFRITLSLGILSLGILIFLIVLLVFVFPQSNNKPSQNMNASTNDKILKSAIVEPQGNMANGQYSELRASIYYRIQPDDTIAWLTQMFQIIPDYPTTSQMNQFYNAHPEIWCPAAPKTLDCIRPSTLQVKPNEINLVSLDYSLSHPGQLFWVSFLVNDQTLSVNGLSTLLDYKTRWILLRGKWTGTEFIIQPKNLVFEFKINDNAYILTTNR